MKSLLAILLVASTFTEINNAGAAVPVTACRNYFSSDERNVTNFNGIIAGGPIEVIVKLGNTEGLKFEGDEEAISTLITEVKGNKLVIRPQTSWVSWAKKYENKKIIAYVSAKQLTSLTMSGNGNITVSGIISATEFTTTLSGSGTIKAKVEADKITAVVSGSGTANISGKADAASVTLSGTGSFGSKLLNLDQLSARISGKGSIYISTDGKIKAFIVGSGHIYYNGNPEIEKTVIGSGDVIEI